MLGILVIVSTNVIDKSCDVGEYLDYENCKCKKRLINKSVDECTETIEEVTLFNMMKMKIVVNAFLVQSISCCC